MEAQHPKRISVPVAALVAALMALSGYALALTVTQTRTTFEAISGGQIRVTDSIQVTPWGVKTNRGIRLARRGDHAGDPHPVPRGRDGL